MKLPELKAFLKLRGGLPGTLRKAELVQQCRQFATTMPVQQIAKAVGSAPSSGHRTSNSAGSTTHNDSKFHQTVQSVSIPDPAFAYEPPKRWRRIAPGELTQQQRPYNSRNYAPSVTQEASTGISCDTPLWDEAEFQAIPGLNHPYGAERDKRVSDPMQQGEMEITFLGTASCIPGTSRGVSCMALRLNSDLWLFDCGEGTQVQLKKSKLRASKISKIFITHMHGDHAFGLAGVLCMIGQAMSAERERLHLEGNKEVLEPIDIFGPEGIRNMVRTVMQISHSRVAVPHRIHELRNIPYLHHGQAPPQPVIVTQFDGLYGEREGGRDIYPDSSGVFRLFDDGTMCVHAAAMQHTIPCVGFVAQEADRIGALRPEAVRDVIVRNKLGLMERYKAEGRDPMTVYKDLKSLQQDECYTFPDGTVVQGQDVVSPALRGRKIVYMGDTCNGDRIGALAQDCDVLVHEATNAFFPEDAKERRLTYAQVESETIAHGHSTPQMAARFAAAVNARQLILSHFSSRYPGDESLFSMRIMWKIEEMARRAWLQVVGLGGGDASSSSNDGTLNLTGENISGTAASSSSSRSTGGSDSSTNVNAATYEGAPEPYQHLQGHGPLSKNGVLAAWDFMSLLVDVRGAESRLGKGKQPPVKINAWSEDSGGFS